MEVFLVHWEDPLLLAYAVRFYRERLGMAGVRITVYDNESKDGSAELVKAFGCRVVTLIHSSRWASNPINSPPQGDLGHSFLT